MEKKKKNEKKNGKFQFTQYKKIREEFSFEQILN